MQLKVRTLILDEKFLRDNSEVNIRNYRGVFYELWVFMEMKKKNLKIY